MSSTGCPNKFWMEISLHKVFTDDFILEVEE